MDIENIDDATLYRHTPRQVNVHRYKRAILWGKNHQSIYSITFEYAFEIRFNLLILIQPILYNSNRFYNHIIGFDIHIIANITNHSVSMAFISTEGDSIIWRNFLIPLLADLDEVYLSSAEQKAQFKSSIVMCQNNRLNGISF